MNDRGRDREDWERAPSRKDNKRQGSPPMSVQKLEAAIKSRGLDYNGVNLKLGVPFQRVYRWVHNTGEPFISHAIPLARILDVSILYLIDDSVPVSLDPPKFVEPGEIAARLSRGEGKVQTVEVGRSAESSGELTIDEDDISQACETVLDLQDELDELTLKLRKFGRVIGRASKR